MRFCANIAKRSVSPLTKVRFERQNLSSFKFAYAELVEYCFKCCFYGGGSLFFSCYFYTCKAFLMALIMALITAIRSYTIVVLLRSHARHVDCSKFSTDSAVRVPY